MGQQVSVQAKPGTDSLQGSISALTDRGGTRVAALDLTWATPLAFGTPLDIGLVLQRKDDVLLLSQRALRRVSGRRYVDLVEGNSQRRVEVEIGITSSGDTEILSGLREGQIALLTQ